MSVIFTNIQVSRTVAGTSRVITKYVLISVERMNGEKRKMSVKTAGEG